MATTQAPVAATPTPVAPVHTEKKNDATTFLIEFLMGGISAAVSKTIAAPIELIKLRLQNMDAMIKAGTLTTPYTGIADVASRVTK
jgi:solute carrier family 25 (adenine nucleotide translocator) protein 4/5/6/31